eukprot:jgi/Undpi1/10068/HiC_scaffold_28.g12522.m1
MATEMDQSFGKVLESHRDWPAPTSMATIRDPTFTVQRSSLDAPFFAEMASILSCEPVGEQNIKQKNPFVMVQRHLSTAMKNFLANDRMNPAARRAVATASLSLFRNSCSITVPSKLSKMAANVVLQALDATSKEPCRGVVLGSEGFPESQLAAFFLDATRTDPPPPPAPAIVVPAGIAVKIIVAFGIGKARQDAVALEWGTPTVADCLRGSVRRVADRLREGGEWKTMAELVEHMQTPRGVDECEGVLGNILYKKTKTTMIPAASDAEAYDIATRLIEENNLVSEFPDYRVLQVEYMQSLGNLPAAAQLMDYFDLHRDLPKLDPRLVEASARKRAAAHLRLPISESRVVLVDNMGTLKYAQQALRDPPGIGERGGAPGVSCVGLDVESCPVSAMATLLQVATSTDVFLFDLDAICGYGDNGDSRTRANATGSAYTNTNRNDASNSSNGNSNSSSSSRPPYRRKPPPQQPRRPRHDELARCFDSTIGALFASPRIVKLGFSFDNDAAMLRKTWPHVRGFRRVVAVLEVGELGESAFGKTTPSLSSTCEAWLGKPLDKTECASKWNLRPLTVDQVRYAALDAHCLVGIFEEMLLERRGEQLPEAEGPGSVGDPARKEMSKRGEEEKEEEGSTIFICVVRFARGFQMCCRLSCAGSRRMTPRLLKSEELLFVFSGPRMREGGAVRPVFTMNGFSSLARVR